MKSLMFMILLALAMAELHTLNGQGPCPPPALQAPAVVVEEIAPAKVAVERVAAEGLPVPIFPGTRVDVAQVSPPARPKRSERVLRKPPSLPVRDETLKPALKFQPKPSRPGLSKTSDGLKVAGRLSATERRAWDDARLQLEHAVRDWLAPDAPAQWKPPARLVDQLIVDARTIPIVKDYGTLYETTLDVDLTAAHRAELLQVYDREVVAHRLTGFGGVLAFILACLAAVAGYIRADEATKGYYTNWLRAAATAGVGASAVLLYQMLT
jgi:hypothetical protein